jgi:uncharacterized membrane protein HdeD (DUF308 family)
MTTIERPATVLRNLYFVRFGFAVAWAVLVVATGPGLTPTTTVLAVLYPLFDLVAVIVDARRGHPDPILYVNMAVSLLATVGVVLAAGSGLPGVLRVWGAWAIASGATQLIVAARRRGLSGQRALVLSGGLSLLAGTGFIVQAGMPSASLVGPAGYAAFGGVLFLIAGLRLRSAATRGH